MKFKDLVGGVLEVSPRLPWRISIPFVPIALECGLILEAQSACFPAVHDAVHLPFRVRFGFFIYRDHDRRLWFPALAWVGVIRSQV